MNCEVKNCTRKARFGIYRTSLNGEKTWLHVCKECEGEIGMKNLGRVGIRMVNNGKRNQYCPRQKKQKEKKTFQAICPECGMSWEVKIVE